MIARCPLVLLLSLSLPAVAHGQSYHISSSTFDSAGGISANSLYRLGTSAGQPVAGSASGSSYNVGIGFWRKGILPVTDVDRAVEVGRFALYPNAPNPFDRRTTIRYDIPASAGPVQVSVRLYDLSGRMVRELDSGSREPGVHTTSWDGLDEAGNEARDGVYFYRIETAHFTATHRLVLLR